MAQSFNERFAFLRQHQHEHAAHTVRISALMGTTPPRPGRIVFSSGHIDALGPDNNTRRFWPVQMPRRRYLRIAYLTGWRDGLGLGLLGGLLLGLLIACAAVALGAYGSIESLRWLP